ncbi:MAG: IS256 family transposase [Chloroflexota bacterium]|nr:MAG: IS256 family transposase [Chloroflexota bacterium]
MATERMTLLDQIEKAAAGGDVDFLRQAVKTMAEALMELEVAAKLGAAPYERTADRTGYRNGHRVRTWDTRVGTIELEIPRLRRGSYFPGWLLERRRRAERALFAVIAEAYVLGVSTRKVDALVRTLGVEGISKSEVSRLCSELDRQVRAFRERRLDEHRYPYLWLDAKVAKVREGGRIVSMAILVAIAVNERGEREVVGLEVGSAETGPLWTAFLRSLVARGLSGVVLVISDAHVGLREAIRQTLLGATWQRCRTHTIRDVLAHVPKAAQGLVAAYARTIFHQPDGPSAHAQLGQVAEQLGRRFPKAAEVLLGAADDVLAYTAVPREHWSKVWSTNPLERLHRELARRIDVVGIFPNREALVRLAGALLAEQHDEWLTADRRYLPEGSLNRLLGGVRNPTIGELLKEGAAV